MSFHFTRLYVLQDGTFSHHHHIGLGLAASTGFLGLVILLACLNGKITFIHFDHIFQGITVIPSLIHLCNFLFIPNSQEWSN
jgi:hypothetical protein